MLQIDNVKSLEEILDHCCPEKSYEDCMRDGCNKCEAEYLNEQGVMVRVFGRWKKVNDKSPKYCCSVCNHLYNNKEYKFCPFCGAIMRGAENEN